MPITRLVDDPEWQIVRKSLIGNWIQNHEKNVRRLREYLEVNHWSPEAIRRVLNVLTGSVHRSKKTQNQIETNQLRAEVRRAWRHGLGETFDETDPKYTEGIC